MRILLTGASSFTGAWFAHELAAAGHQVTATLRGALGTYSGTRSDRVSWLRSTGATLVEDCSFGSERFMETVAAGFDVLCHHAAVVENYRSPDFDAVAAVASNTLNLSSILKRAKAAGLGAVIYTGSVFEQDEGAGDAPLRAFSPYGLSKGLTWQVVKYHCDVLGLRTGKFVIPNPFGPHEEPRFCAYLVKQWAKGETPQVNTPLYVRDNIPVSRLAAAYAAYVSSTAKPSFAARLSPSGFVESQGAFALRFAAEMKPRLGIETPVVLGVQTDFSEPMVRINTDYTGNADEPATWDALAAYYRKTYLGAQAPLGV